MSAYLANGTYAFALSTQTLAGLGALHPVLAVGALPAVDGVVTADTLTARDPLSGRRGAKVKANDIAHAHVHPALKTQQLHHLRTFW